MRISKKLILYSSIALWTLILPEGYAQEPPPDFFTHVEAPANARMPEMGPEALHPEVMRQTVVEADPSLLTNAAKAIAGRADPETPKRFRFNLFPDVSFVIVIDRVAPPIVRGETLFNSERLGMFGHIEGDRSSYVHIGIGGGVRLSVTIDTSDGEKFKVFSLSGNTHVIQEIDRSMIGDEGDDEIILEENIVPNKAPPSPDNQGLLAPGAGGTDNGSTIDVMFLYSSQAQTDLEANGKGSLWDQVGEAVSDANDALAGVVL